jgi:hypothetical protein
MARKRIGVKAMPIFKRKPTLVDAEQFLDPDNPPRGVEITHLDDPSMNRRHHVTTMQGRQVDVSVGEWIVAEADGVHFYPIANAEFERIYEPT